MTTQDDPNLYWEARGAGKPLLLIPPTPGDAGHFSALAPALAEDHLVISYDRRGTSRSAGPAGGVAGTSVAQQADDAAAMLRRVGVGPAVVFGTSYGAAVALELALRHQQRVAGVVLHEMPLMTVLADPGEVQAALGELIGGAMQHGGPAAALDAFMRFAYGEAIVEGWDPSYRDRLYANADSVFSVELPAFQSYRPDEAALRDLRIPVAVLVGADQAIPFFTEAAIWLASRLGTVVETAPGAHGAYYSCPEELAAAIRGFSTGIAAS